MDRGRMKLDVLAFSAHPDDVEISMGGTLAKLEDHGKSIGIIDLTRGELGSRGNAELRSMESAEASKILGITHRHNLEWPDGFFETSREGLMSIIEEIRRFQPDIVFANSVRDRHPDHQKAGDIVEEACFLSGLRKIETGDLGHWRPKAVYRYIQDYYIEPSFVVDISEHFDIKMRSIAAYSSQFYNSESKEPATPISGEDFFEFLKGRAMQFGRPAGFKYGEGFTSSRYLGVSDVFDLC